MCVCACVCVCVCPTSGPHCQHSSQSESLGDDPVWPCSALEDELDPGCQQALAGPKQMQQQGNYSTTQAQPLTTQHCTMCLNSVRTQVNMCLYLVGESHSGMLPDDCPDENTWWHSSYALHQLSPRAHATGSDTWADVRGNM